MQILLFIVFLTVGGLLNFIIKAKTDFIYKLAIIYIFLAMLISAGSWVFYFAGIKQAFLIKGLSLILEWGKSIGHLIAGYLIISILFTITSVHADNYSAKKIISLTLLAVSIVTGNTFLIATVGKAENMADMISFFTTSGYAIWFLYFIMVAETLGGLGILLHFKLKTGPFAAAGLMLIMIGALYTHCHNRDPFSDSYAAISQFISLALIQTIYYFAQIVFEKN